MIKKLIIIILAFISALSSFDLKKYEPRQITTSTSRESDIVIKDENTIFFASDRAGNFDVFKKDLIRETITQITFQPSNEYPALYDGKIIMKSDETDIYGNIYYLTEEGDQELLYPGIGEELNPGLKDNKIFYSEKSKDTYLLKSFDLKKRKKPKQVKDGIGVKAILYGENEVIYQSGGDVSGYNNLFISAVSDTDSSEASEPLQITFGQKIITGFDISKDEKTIVYSAITTDTNGDTKLDRSDNSILYRIIADGQNFSDPLQLTSESYSSSDPKISPNGNIFYISSRKGNPDIWSCGSEGVAPYKKSYAEQKELSDYLLENYKAKILLSEALGEKPSDETTELLANALLSYYRTVTFSEQADDKKAEAYFKIAEIYEIQEKYRMAESIYRILQSRFQSSESISGTAELKRVSVEILRKGISIKDYGYELDEHIRYLNFLLEKFKDAGIKNLINLRIGEIYFNLKSFQTANGYFLKARSNPDESENSESWFWQAKTAFGAGNIQTAGLLLEKAIQLAKSYDEKEKYIRQYFAFSEKDQSEEIGRITETTLNENLPVELISYANLILGDLLKDNDQKIETLNEVKKYFVSAPDNPLLKKFSAQADIKLSKLYMQAGPEEAVESVLEYMIANYKGINYDLYPVLAQKTLSEIYLKRAKNYLIKKMNDNALLTYTKAYELDKTNVEIIRGITDSYNNLGKINEAINFFSREYADDENNAYLNYALGYCYSLRGTAGGTAFKADITEAVRYLNRCIDIESSVKYAYLTLSFCYEALYHISVTEAENEKKKNVLLKSILFITGPFKFLLEKVNIIEDASKDNTDMAISLLGKGMSLCDKTADKELLLKMKLNTANNYYNMGEYARKQALDYYKQVIDEGYLFSSKEQEALIYERAGHCLFTLEDESAEEYYNKAISLYRELNDRKGEIRISMRTALLYLTREDKEGDMIGGDDAYQKYSEILIKLKSEDNKNAVNLIKRNSAFAKFVDEEYEESSGITSQILSEDTDYKYESSKDNLIILSILGLDIPVWKLDLILGSQYSEGFEGKDELALLFSIEASSYGNLKDFTAVKELLNKKSEIFKKKGNDLAVSLIENRLGIVEYLCSNWDESIKRFERSKELCIKLELYNVALTNENNILKAKIRSFDKKNISSVNSAVEDTTVYSLASSTSDLFDKAVYHNLKGVLSFKSYKSLITGDPGEKFAALRHLIRSERFFFKADSIIQSQTRTNEEKNRLTASVLYNLAITMIESGNLEKAAEIFIRGSDLAKATYDKLLQWRYLLKAGDIESEPEEKLGLYIEAEIVLSGYLPATADYELVSGWKEDIKPLYDRLIESHLRKNDLSSAMNYAERFKNRILLNYYSSRYLDYKEQLHKIHVRKIRYNNDEIVRYRQKADLLKNKNPLKYAKLIEEYEKQAGFYENELKDIYEQIKKSNDERLLQFVSIEDIGQEQLSELLGEYKAVISIYSLSDAELFFYYDQNGVQYKRSEGSDCSKIFDGFIGSVKEKEHVFIIPDIDGSINVNYTSIAKNKGLGGINFTVLPTVSSYKMVTENANINYSELKKASETDAKDEELSSLLENGGILYIDKPVEINRSNALDDIFIFGKNKIKLGDFLRLKLPAYAVVIRDFSGDVSPIDKVLISNSLIFSGVQTIIIPQDDIKDSLSIQNTAKKISENAGEKDIVSILKDDLENYNIVGLTGMDKETQREFATSNLKNSLMNAVRYYNSKVYEKAAVYFLQALAMARNIGDKQELNILKTLTSSLSKIKDYKRAIIYGEQLVVYTEKNKLEKEKLLAYDALSKDYFRNKQYGKAADYQISILNDGKSELKNKLDAYDMLSVIYSYKGDLKSSISYKKEYLKYSQLISSDDLSSFKEELDGKATEVLFNSLRNIMVSFYKNGDLDSALYVYHTIIENKAEFEDVNFDSFGELLESAGLCYFKKSDYKKAEELYFEAIDYFTEDAKKTSVYLNLSDLYYFTDKLSSALKYLSEAGKTASSDPEKMRIFNTRSLIEVKQDNLPAAATYSYKALEKTIEMNDRSEESTARVNLAKILILSGDITGAKKNLSRSKELSQDTKNIKALLSAEFYQGEIFLENAKNPDSALVHYKKCLNLSISDNDEYFKGRALYRTGESYFNKQQNDSAEFYIQKSLESSDRFGFNDIYIKSAFKLSEIYEKTQPDRALSILGKLSERAEKLAFESENRFAEDYEGLIREGFEKQIYLLIKNSEFEKAISIVKFRDNIFKVNDLKYLGINTGDNQIYRIKDLNLLKDIQKELKKESALMIFLPYGGSANLLIITNDMLKNFEFKIIKEMTEIPERIETKSDFIQLSKRSYENIFTKELSALIIGRTDIIVYSSGVLKNFPFEVLYDGQNFIIDKYNISEINDISDRSFGVGAGSFAKTLSFVNPFTAESELVYAEREYGALSALNKNSGFTGGNKATESLFKTDGIRSYKTLHLPVHSFILSKDSVRTANRSSYVQLSADGSNDGRLEWGEIIKLDGNGKEIILSGCDTGGKTGKYYYDYFDLSQAFDYAGADIIISSKWKTDDLAAGVLMKRYFRYVASGSDRVSALSKAKRDVKAYLNPHPYYWANFKISIK